MKVIEQIVRLEINGNETKAEVIGTLTMCKDCKHSELIEEDSDARYCYCHRMFHFEDYYCADGKRKDGGADGS